MHKALKLKDIPPQYRELPVLGRGVTSVVYDGGPYAICVTCDSIKSDWLTCYWGPQIGAVQDYGDGWTAITMPIMQRCRSAAVRKELNAANAIHRAAVRRSKQFGATAAYDCATAISESDQFPLLGEQLVELFEFLSNYDGWMLDLHMGNVMLHNGKPVLVDPVISKWCLAA